MKGKIILFAIMFLATLAGALAVKETTTSYSPISVLQESSEEFSVTITNSGDETIDEITLSLSSFVNGSHSFSGSLSSDTIIDLLAGEEAEIMIEVSPGNVPAGIYLAELEIDSDGNVQTSVIEVEVEALDSELSTPGSVTFVVASGQESATRTFSITNSGESTLENLVISSTLASQYNPSLNPTSIASLAPGESRSISLQIDLPSGVDSSNTLIGQVRISNNEVSKNVNVFLRSESKLTVNDIEIKVGNDRTKDMQDGDTADDEAAPGDEITLEFEVENLFTDDEDVDIEDIEVELTVVDIDDGDDIEIDASEFDLDPEDTEDVKFTFNVPFIVDEERYALEVHIEGEDDEGTIHEYDFTVYIEVEKERHEIRVERVEISPQSISCSRTSSVEVTVVNTGSDDEDVRVVVSSRGLNLEAEREFELEEGDDSDSRRSVSVSISVLDDQVAGIYPIEVDVYRGSSREESEVLELEVRNCEINFDEEDDVTPPSFEIQNSPGVSIPLTTKPTSSFDAVRESDLYLGALGVLVLILAIIVVMMLLPRR